MITLVRIEFLKLRTTPALLITTLCTLALTLVAVGSAVLAPAGKGAAAEVGSLANVSQALSQPDAVMGMGMFVLGILLVGTEFRQRTIIGTYLGEPRRGRVLVAKMATIALVGATLSALVFTAAYALMVCLYAGRGVHHLGDLVDLPTVAVGTIIGASLFGLLGVALGAMTRSSVTAIVGGLVWIQLVEVAILENLVPGVAKWLPTGTAQALASGWPQPDLLSPVPAGVVLFVWAVAMGLAAAVVSSRWEVR